jgi:hypothetical protein
LLCLEQMRLKRQRIGWGGIRRALGVASLFILLISVVGQPAASAAGAWTITNRTTGTGISGNNFYPVAMSADGKYMYSAAHAQGIYISTDYGQTWAPTPNFNAGDYWGMATSSDGRYVYAVAHNTDVWFSADYGQTWTKRTSGPQSGYSWSSIETSANGQFVIIGTDTQGVYISNDYGATLTAASLSSSDSYWGVTVSADGTFLSAIQTYGTAYVSTDSGATWTASGLPTGGPYFEAAASSTGQYLATVAQGSSIYTSSDYGATWMPRTGPGNQTWIDVKLSGSGQYGVAVAFGGDIWATSDYGVTWVNQTTGTSFSNLNYQYVEISDDGKYILTGVENGDLYVGVNASIGVVTQNVTTAVASPVKAPNTGLGVNVYKYLQAVVVISSASVVLGLLMSRRRIAA